MTIIVKFQLFVLNTHLFYAQTALVLKNNLFVRVQSTVIQTKRDALTELAWTIPTSAKKKNITNVPRIIPFNVQTEIALATFSIATICLAQLGLNTKLSMAYATTILEIARKFIQTQNISISVRFAPKTNFNATMEPVD